MHFKSSASLTLTLLTVGAMIAAPAQAQNMVTNPGFETGDLTGYTSSGSAFLALGPHSGTYAATVNSQTSPSRLSQNIATVAGNTYNVSFFLWNRDDVNGNSALNEFQASFAGFQGVDVVNAATFNYKQFNFTAVATGPSSILTFAVPSRGFFWLDDLSVTAAAPVPEASSVVSLGLLLLLGLGGVAVSRWRKAGAAR